MRQVKINGKQANKTMKSFRMGNGVSVSFKSYREAGKFIADTNSFLTDTLVILNETYIQLFEEYRRAWFVGINAGTGTKTNYTAETNRMRSLLNTASDGFDKFMFVNAGNAEPFFSFIDMMKIALFLGEAAEQLVSFHKKRNATANLYTCRTLMNRCKLVHDKLKNYGAGQ